MVSVARNILLTFCCCIIAFPVFAAPKLDYPSKKKLLSSKKIVSYDNPIDAIKHGKFSLSFRLRDEHVNQDNNLIPARATTLRTLLGFETARFKGLSLFVQGIDVARIGQHYYNSGAGTSPAWARYSTVADPSVLLLNQLFINFDTYLKTSFKVGRQIINLDNQRFVGSVGFRQNDQTFDTASITNNLIPDLTLYYAYVNKVHRIFGPDALNNAGAQRNRTQFFHINFHQWKLIKIIPYAYLIHNFDQASFSTKSYGVRIIGTMKPKDIGFIYTLEYAHQNGAYNNPVHYSAYFLDASAGIIIHSITIKYDQQRLSGDSTVLGSAFITPLATLHAFQGWADLFLITPSTGVIDNNLSLLYQMPSHMKLYLKAIYHHFSAQAINQDFGDEIDLAIGSHFNKYLSWSVMYADFFNANQGASFVDTQKVWLTLSAKLLG